MRTREQIQNDPGNAYALLIEVMLDVRELLLDSHLRELDKRPEVGGLAATGTVEHF